MAGDAAWPVAVGAICVRGRLPNRGRVGPFGVIRDQGRRSHTPLGPRALPPTAAIHNRKFAPGISSYPAIGQSFSAWPVACTPGRVRVPMTHDEGAALDRP